VRRAAAAGATPAHGDSLTLRVGIDGRGFASPAAGVRRYVANLVSAIPAVDADVEIVALGGLADTIPPGVRHIGEPWHPPTNLGWTLIGLPRAAARSGVDVLHAPSYTAPFWSPVPVVVTIHDVSYARHPEWYPYRRDWARRAFYRGSALAAAHIVTVSAFSAEEIVAAYGVPAGRVSVTPLGVSHGMFAPGDDGSIPALPVEVTTPYVLHVGDLHERRNLGVVVEALAGVRRRFGSAEAMSLVLAGVDRGVGDALCGLAADNGAADAVIRLGAVDELLLRALYRSATALVYPSLYEGFGLPLLEAMASGTPVIASRAASIPEVVGDAGILLDPSDAAAWAEAIVRVANTPSVRDELRAAGLARVAAFTWERTARTTIEVYRQVVRR
jgi:glycosyltransferase involved in cell wall biosynthesis